MPRPSPSSRTQKAFRTPAVPGVGLLGSAWRPEGVALVQSLAPAASGAHGLCRSWVWSCIPQSRGGQSLTRGEGV